MSDKRYTKDGEYLSKAATLELNERHGWLQYGDAQSEASNAFANNAVHAFLESAKQAQEVMDETGLTLRELVEQRNALAATLGEICGLSPAIRFGGPDPMDLEELSDALSSAVDLAHSTLALVKGAKP